ncbi:Laminin B type IV [Gemmatirosa kalamazoonensis]|uniref:Laminin B type IV n=1 Tax=Gemmatirosa kalamazoonensis TaxID=861299 RepID=W0RDF8_9BACT|nr:laminin B domain-containing protein [Gemmatirosa kalamazoonensis]AHG88821.1 Laminin B type IV [Gemmatirosa kalamazoonensis]
MQKRTLAVAVLGSLLTSVASAQSSSFNNGSDGWRIGELYGTGGGNRAATFLSDGFVQTSDAYGWNAYWAPEEYLGDKSSYYGGSLSLDLRVSDANDVLHPTLLISDGTTRLQYRFDAPETWWDTYVVPLSEDGWEMARFDGSAGAPVSHALFMQVLSHLAFIHVDADWKSSGGHVDLDNVRMGTNALAVVTPEPVPLALLASAALGLGLVATRRRD